MIIENIEYWSVLLASTQTKSQFKWHPIQWLEGLSLLFALKILFLTEVATNKVAV